jgi:replicative DNA helicase
MSVMSGSRRGAPIVEVRLEKLFDRTPPHAPEAEMALLGAMILEPRVIADVIPILKTPDVFYSEAHKVIYEALVQTYDRKQAGNLVLLSDLLRDKDALEDVGDKKYLQHLAESTPGPATAVHFARIVLDKAKLRRLIEAGGETVYDAYHSGDSESVREIIDKAESRIFEIAQEEETAAAESLAILVQREYDRLEALHGKGISGTATGYHDLDELTSGLQKGEMIIVAARPSMGKTALALNLAEQVALGGVPHEKRDPGRKSPVGVFSLEMSKSAVALRMLSARSGISSHDMRSGRMQPQQYDRLLTACGELHEAPIYVDDTPGLTILGLRTRARRMVSQHGVKCIFIDYLQLMTAPGSARESRQVEVSAISRGVKALARELDIPVICLSQLNRGPESRGDNRPRMSDLRESGSIEQDAYVVILLHREDYYHVGDEDWHSDPANEGKVGVADDALQEPGAVRWGRWWIRGRRGRWLWRRWWWWWLWIGRSLPRAGCALQPWEADGPGVGLPRWRWAGAG